MNIKELQNRIVSIKKELNFLPPNREYTPSVVKNEFLLLYGEVAESFCAYSNNKNDLYAELADVAIYLLSICEMTGCDLEDAILRKLKIVKNRHYEYINESWIKTDKKSEEKQE